MTAIDLPERETSMTDPGRLTRLQQIAEQFRTGAYQDVADALQAEPDEGGEMGRAMLLTARAMVLDASGQSAAAGPLMEEALGLIVPDPNVLETIAKFFLKHGQPMLAHYAFLMADLCQPGSLATFEALVRGPERARYAPWALRASDKAQREDLYAMGLRKAELRERLGPDGAAMMLASMAGPQGAYVANERPLHRLIDYASKHATDLKELGVPRTVAYAPANVHGQPDAPSSEKTTRPFFTCALKDVVVSAKSDILLTHDAALVDGVSIKDTHLFFDVDPILGGGGPERAFVVEPADLGSLRNVPEALWLSGIDSRGFGHWVTEYLPRIWAFVGHPRFAELPILIDEGMPPQMEESLRMFVGPANQLIQLARGERVHVDSLWVTSRIFRGEAVDVDAWLDLMERARPVLEQVDTSGSPERVYLARQPWQHRKLTNAKTIEASVAARGYHIVDFAQVPFVEQVRLIRGARHVLGPDGSASLTTFLGRQGLRIGKLAPPFLDVFEGYVQICAAMGQDLTVLTGTLEERNARFHHMSDYSIDPQELAAYLDDVDRELEAERSSDR